MNSVMMADICEGLLLMLATIQRIFSISVYPRNLLMIFMLMLAALFSNNAVSNEVNKVIGPEECSECHELEVKAWRQTHHFDSYRKMPRSKDAKKIAKKLGIKRIKKGSDCLNCHFTVKDSKTIAGVSCESCHNPAQDWLKIHDDYGGSDTTKEQETSQHKLQRLTQMDAAGMFRSGMYYNIVTNCYKCHLVPNEKLVNVGGHKPGSEFEFVAWSQGEIRHNFGKSKSGTENLEAPVETRRIMFIVGAAVELEYSLRSLAKATEKATFGIKMAKRTQQAIHKLEEINALLSISKINDMLTAAKSVKLKLNNRESLIAAADKVASVAKELASGLDGARLVAIEPLLPTKYKGSALR